MTNNGPRPSGDVTSRSSEITKSPDSGAFSVERVTGIEPAAWELDGTAIAPDSGISSGCERPGAALRGRG